MGASGVADGPSATHTHMTNSWNTPVEALEHQYPFRIRAYRIRSASGGNGRHRGGDGIVREFEFLTAAEVTILSDRRLCGPYGLWGGASGAPGRNVLLRGKRKSAVAGKARFEVEPGDVLRIETPGGGGYGETRTKLIKANMAKFKSAEAGRPSRRNRLAAQSLPDPDHLGIVIMCLLFYFSLQSSNS